MAKTYSITTGQQIQVSEDQMTIADFDPDYVEVIGETRRRRNDRIRRVRKEGFDDENPDDDR